MQLQHVTFEANFRYSNKIILKLHVLMMQVTSTDHIEARLSGLLKKCTLLKNKNLKHLYLSELQFLLISLYFASISDPFEIEEIEK